MSTNYAVIGIASGAIMWLIGFWIATESYHLDSLDLIIGSLIFALGDIVRILFILFPDK